MIRNRIGGFLLCASALVLSMGCALDTDEPEASTPDEPVASSEEPMRWACADYYYYDAGLSCEACASDECVSMRCNNGYSAQYCSH